MSCDLGAFREALARGDLRRALQLQTLDFAGRIRRPPGEAFEDWLEGKRERFRRELREAAALRWDQSYPTGDWNAACDAAEVLHALDPSNEQAVRMVIEARARTGGPEGAEAAYLDFLEGLDTGHRPAPETLELMERVRRLARDTPAPGAGGAHREARVPLIGRETELGAARDALDRVRAGAFEFVLLKGEAGIGKTRLLEEITREAQLKGFRCLRASPVELEQRIPLNPLVDALAGADAKRHVLALDDPWKAVLSAVLPYQEPGEDPLPVPRVEESRLSRRLYEAFSILFSRMAAGEPTLLVVDDIQWADATTVAVLQFTQRRWRSGAFGVMAAMRPESGRADEDIGKYLDPGGDLAVTPIDVGDLDADGAMRLVRAVAGEPVSVEAVQGIMDLGGCNPFYLIELTRDYVAGRLALPDTPRDGVTIPISLRQLVDARIEHLSEDAVRAASVMATWGSPLRLVDLAAVTNVRMEQCVGVVEELARWGFVEQSLDTVRFAHALFRSAFYSRLNEARKVLLHEMVAERLVSRQPPPCDELALHFARAARAEGAVQFGRQAATNAMENGALAEAAYFFQIVVENEREARGKAEATADLARALQMKHEIARANPLLELAATRLRSVGNENRALRMDIHRVKGLAEVAASPLPDLLDRLATIKTTARTVEDWEALALALDAELQLLHRGGMVEKIRSLFAEVRECAAKPEPAVASVANASLALNVLFGDREEGLKSAEKAVAMAERTQDPGALLLAFNRLVLVLAFEGRLYLPGATAVLERAQQVAESYGDLQLRFDLACNEGVFYLDAGDLEPATDAIDRAAALIDGAEAPRLHYSVACNRGEIELERRSFADARRYFDAAEAALRRSSPAWHAAVASAGIGLAALHTGAIAEATRREAELPPDPPSWYFDPTLILSFRARMLERRRQPAEAVALLRRQADGLAVRQPLPLVRTEILASRISRRAGLVQDQRASDRALVLAQRFGLATRARELRQEAH
ncbi:MAG: AAA family ATPase [Gemmatimonadetes bacterium]|nr:AAA family ATPase [Gemmatimonadota bacterium]